MMTPSSRTSHRHTASGSTGNTVTGTLLATSFGFIVVQLDVTIVNVALPEIGSDLSTGITGLQWVVDAYTLTFAALLLTAGAAGDRFGSRNIFKGGLLLFCLASLTCALTPSVDILIAARSLQGAGAALILPTSLALLSHACADDSVARSHAIGWWSAIGGAVSAMGPIVGGLLITSLGWRSIFFVNIPVCLFSLWAVHRYVAETPKTDSKSFDLPGQFLAILLLFLVTYSVIEAGGKGWLDAEIWTGLGIALFVGLLFVVRENRAAEPMIPLSIFRNSILTIAVILGLLSNLTFYALIFILSIFFQSVKGYTPTETGLALLPFTVIMIANIASSRVAGYFSARLTVAGGGILCVLSFVVLHGLDRDTPYYIVMLSMVLLAIGSGISTPALTSAILGNVSSSRSATASAIFNVSRQVGSALGVALLGGMIIENIDDMTIGARLAFDISVILRMVGVVLAVLFL
jgi:DHA2 family methylenomycin A resistance protein-like MFS transporter